MAGIYKIGITSFAGFHVASQIVAALCSAAAAVVLYRFIRPAAPEVPVDHRAGVPAGADRAEIGNGMEMSLLGSLVVLGILLLLRDDDGSRWPAVAALAALVPWIRWKPPAT